MHITDVVTAFHLHGAASFFRKRLFMNCRVDAAHDSIIASADTHFAIDHKRNTAKHSFLFHLGQVRERFTDAVGELFVVGHDFKIN